MTAATNQAFTIRKKPSLTIPPLHRRITIKQHRH
jgi:hypothetical protein